MPRRVIEMPIMMAISYKARISETLRAGREERRAIHLNNKPQISYEASERRKKLSLMKLINSFHGVTWHAQCY
jgi:hypothetical protein